MMAPAGDPDVIRRYHEATKHSPARLRQDPHMLDWDTMPLPFKVYPDLAPVALPPDIGVAPVTALAALAGGSAPAPALALDRAALARLLHLSAGVLRHRQWPGGEIWFRAAACTGALYHVDLYPVTAALADLPAAVWHYGAHDHALRALRDGDWRATLVDAAADPTLAGAPVLLVYASTFWRNAWKYRARAWRHAFWDAGTILANLLALARAAGIPARVVQAFVDAHVNRLLGLDGEREAALGIVALGGDAPPPPAAVEPPSLAHATLPLSSREVRYAAIEAAHAASSLTTAEAVHAARVAVDETAPTADGGTIPLVPLPADAVREPLEAVIMRRGSSRRFPRTAIDLSRVATVLDAAAGDVDTDMPVRPTPFLLVHAVDGLAPGVYRVDPRGRRLLPLHAADVRRDAGFLALQQDLAADAAVNVYWLVDLEATLAAQGARGYRAAQLAAAVAGGRAYLAAYALGLGATGLTFFDDAVATFVGATPSRHAVLFLMALGVGGTPKRTPGGA